MSNPVAMHPMERYCQRVLGMTEAASKEYVKENRDEVQKKFLAAFDQASLIWYGTYSPEHREGGYYYHPDGYIFIKVYESFATIFKCDYGFGEAIDKQIAKKLYEQIISGRSRLQKQKETDGVKLDKIDFELRAADTEITKLKKRLEWAETRKQKLDSDKAEIHAKQESVKAEIEAVSMKLINSMQFKLEVLKSRKAG